MNAKAVDLLNFYGMTLTVVEADDVRYVRLRPVVEVLGLSWRHSRATAMSEENTALFGIRQLSMLPLDTLFDADFLTPYGAKNGARAANLDASNAKNTEDDTDSVLKVGAKQTSKPEVYIRLDRVHLYLARVNTAQMRAKGKEEAADQLLKLQQEWADVLYRYESGEVIAKQSAEKHLVSLISAQAKAKDPAQKAALSTMIDKALADLGVPVQRSPSLLN